MAGGVGRFLNSMSGVVLAGRRWTSAKLHRFVVWLQPPFDEDPQAWEVSVVKVAASAPSYTEAIREVYEATRHLDETTVYMVLMLLAADVAWSPTLGSAENAVEWAELRKFHLIAADFDGP